MRDFLLQIEKSLEADLYYLSLISCLTIPDIAGALDSRDGIVSRSRYSAWYDRWVRPQFPRLTYPGASKGFWMFMGKTESPLIGKECYRFRCSLLHQGSSQYGAGNAAETPMEFLRVMLGIDNRRFQRIVFIEPGSTTLELHYQVLGNALCIDLRRFCQEVLAGAREWLDQAESTEPFQTNYQRFARRHPEGLLGISGVPVIG